jgi:hypothetical protein
MNMVWSARNTIDLDLCPSFVGGFHFTFIDAQSLPCLFSRVAGQPVEKVELQEGRSAFHAWSAAVFFVSFPTDNGPGR